MVHRSNAQATISRKLSLPERGAVGRQPLARRDVRACIAKCDRPAVCVVEEERLQRAGEEVYAREGFRHHVRGFVTSARRAGDDRTVDVRVP